MRLNAPKPNTAAQAHATHAGAAKPLPFKDAFAEDGTLVDPNGFAMLTNSTLDVVISKAQCDVIGIKCQAITDPDHRLAWDESLRDPAHPGVIFNPLLPDEEFLAEDFMVLPLHQGKEDTSFGYGMTLGQTALFEQKKWVCIPIEIGRSFDEGGGSKKARNEAMERASAEAARLAPLLDKVGGKVLEPIMGSGDEEGGDTAAWVMALLPMEWAKAQFKAAHEGLSEEARGSNWPGYPGWEDYRQSVIDLFEGKQDAVGGHP